MNEKKKVLFVCLGNICRSPIAEAVFLHLLTERDQKDLWEVDSAGLGGWHSGNLPDHRAISCLKQHGIEYDNRARQINNNDYIINDYIFGMDENNIDTLLADKPKNSKSKILLLGNYDPEGDKIIRDPYYDRGSDGFEKCYQQCVRSCNNFLDKLME